MKVALLISGLIKSTSVECFNSVNDHILQKYDTDVFISTWESKYLDDILRLYNPTFCRVEDFNSNSVKMRLNHFSYYMRHYKVFKKEKKLFSSYPMWYKIYDTNCLKKDYETLYDFKYDLVIRIRFDIDFNIMDFSIDQTLPSFIGLNHEEIDDVLKNDVIYLRKDSYVHENRPENFNEWIWDSFAFGNSKIMDIYCNTFLNLNELILLENNVNEIMLLNQLNKYNVTTKQTKTIYGLRRVSK